MSAAGESREAPSESNPFQNDPWGHEHGEDERGVTVAIHPIHRPEPVAQLVGEPVKIARDHLRALIAILVATALAAATLVAAVRWDWV